MHRSTPPRWKTRGGDPGRWLRWTTGAGIVAIALSVAAADIAQTRASRPRQRPHHRRQRRGADRERPHRHRRRSHRARRARRRHRRARRCRDGRSLRPHGDSGSHRSRTSTSRTIPKLALRQLSAWRHDVSRSGPVGREVRRAAAHDRRRQHSRTAHLHHRTTHRRREPGVPGRLRGRARCGGSAAAREPCWSSAARPR